jgi:hypothetical protein
MTNPCGMHLRTEVPAHGGPETLSAAEAGIQLKRGDA